MVLLLTGPGGLPLTHVSSVTARVADRLKQGLHVVAAEAEEHRAGRAVPAQVPQPGHGDRDLPVVQVVAAAPPLARPQVPGELDQTRNGPVRVAGADAVEHQQDGRVRLVTGPARGNRPAGAPHRALMPVSVLCLPLEEAGVLLQLGGDLLRGLVAVVDLDEQQGHPVLRRGEHDVGLGTALAGRVPLPRRGQRNLGVDLRRPAPGEHRADPVPEDAREGEQP